MYNELKSNMPLLQKPVLPIILFITACIGYMVFKSPLCYLGGDNYIHYKYARYSWVFPHLLLDHWGKPVYTLLCSPFAQLGFTAAKFFNVFIGIATAYFTFLTAEKLGFKNAWLSILFVCCSPMYFMMFNTTMTETSFSFFLIVGVWLFFSDRFFLSALVISFIPMVRTEGFLILLFFFLAFILNRKWKYAPVLITGCLLYSIIGYFFVYHDFLWIINQNPYNGNVADIYGQGPLFYFVSNYKYITGIPLSFLLLLGSIVMLATAVKDNKIKGLILNNELLLIFYPALAYLFMHSLAWWLGKLNSAGELRVFTGIIPLASILGLKGWNFLEQNILRKKLMNRGALLILIFLILKGMNGVYPIAYKPDEVEMICVKASEWIKSSKYYNKKIFYYNPVFYVSLDLNPYDSKRIQERIPDNDHPENGMSIGDIVIWDAHFTPNEGRLPLDKLLRNKNFRLLNLFEPVTSFKVLGGYDYAVYIFQRVSQFENQSGTDIIKKYDFEQKLNDADSSYVTNEHSYSGKFAYKFNSEKVFSPSIILSVADLRTRGALKVVADVEILPLNETQKNDVSLIMSFENDTSYSYNSIKLESVKPVLNQWNHLSIECRIPAQAKDDDKVKIYIYQQNKQFIYIDDFRASIISIADGAH